MRTTESGKQLQQINSIVLLRGVAAVSVMIFHLFAGDRFCSVHWLQAILIRGYLGLFLFFIISGFIIPYSMYANGYRIQQLPRYLLKRLVRIEPPYIVCLILVVIALFVDSRMNGGHDPVDWPRLWTHFGYLNRYFGKEDYNVVFWTLGIELQFYIAMAFLFPLITASRKLIVYGILGIAAVVCFYLPQAPVPNIAGYGLFFVAGILVFLHFIKRTAVSEFIVTYLCIVTLIGFQHGMEMAITALVAAPSILFIKKRWKVTDFFGNISYSLYLVHVPAASWFFHWLNGILGFGITLECYAFVFTLLFATAFYYGIEQPSLRLAKKIRY